MRDAAAMRKTNWLFKYINALIKTIKITVIRVQNININAKLYLCY